jgi:hypothetical protein
MHFIDQRECSDCIPYLVLKVGSQTGLRTSSGVQKIWVIEIKAYFSDSKRQMVRDFRDLIETWLYRGADLGVCGAICVTGNATSSIRNAPGSEVVYSLVFRGSYSQSEVSLDSMSASV